MALLASSLLGLAVTAAALVAQSPAPGLRMYSPHGQGDTFLLDTAGQIVHTWSSAHQPGGGNYLDADGNLLRLYRIGGGPPIGGSGGGIQRIAMDGTILWDWQYADAFGWAHHDCALLPNGNVLMIVWDRMTAQQAIDAGRNPDLLDTDVWLPDTIIEVKQTGYDTADIVWRWRFMDHVIQDHDPSKANYGDVAAHPERMDINYPPTVLTDGEWIHANAIDYDPVNDVICLNSPFQNEFWIIDHSTTTEEAASSRGGRYNMGGDILYRWGNPAAYRAGTEADQKLFFQHNANFVKPGLRGAGNILVFNNRAGGDHSTLVEIDLPTTFWIIPGQQFPPYDFTWEYAHPQPQNFFSNIVSSVQRLPNGNTLAMAGRNPHMIEIDPNDNIVWEFFPAAPPPNIVFRTTYIERTMWSDSKEISLSQGGTVNFDLVAGSPHAGDVFLMLGTTSGTAPGLNFGGVHLALNFDGYLATTAQAANVFPFGNTLGNLDANGRAQSTFTLPGGILPAAAAGLEFHHAYAIFDGDTLELLRTSNATPLTWVE